jgi:hypothetical protein
MPNMADKEPPLFKTVGRLSIEDRGAAVPPR